MATESDQSPHSLNRTGQTAQRTIPPNSGICEHSCESVAGLLESSINPILTNSEIRKLKVDAQRLEPVVRVGKSGLTGAVLQSIEQALHSQELIKIRFDHDREERDALAAKVAEKTGAALIWQVGKVAIYHRPKPVSAD